MPTVSDNQQALLRRLIQKRLAASNVDPIPAPARQSGGTIPLSLNQRQIWLHSQMAPDVPLYNEPFTIHRRGPLDVDCLTRSLNEVIRRHEILRTTFPVVNSEPVQLVLPSLQVNIGVLDANTESRAIELATESALTPFDLSQGPLIRAQLAHLSPTEHRLFLTLHHIIFDGVSIYHVLLPELAMLYEAFSKDQPSPLPPPGPQYADYTLWQRERIGEQGPPEQFCYWERQLSGPRARMTMPADRARSMCPTFQGALYSFFVEGELTDALRRVARENGASLYMVLLAAFHWMLYRYTGQGDMVIGTVTAGRNRPEFARTFGFFLNPLILRTRLGGQSTFRELIGRVRRTVLEALDHADVPFAALTRAFDSQRDRRHNPFYDVLFSLEPPPLSRVPEGWELTQTRVDVGLSKFDLSLEFDERVEGLDGRFVYSTELFDRETIEKMWRDWMSVLVSIVENPDQRIQPVPATNVPDDVEPAAGPLSFVAARNVRDQKLAEIWSELLDLSALPGITDDFFAIGGHSLLIAKLQNRIQHEFGRTLAVREIYTNPTIQHLASLL